MQQMDREAILGALAALNERLRSAGVFGDLCVYGGGTMVLAYNARLSTKDLDAVFQPAVLIREAALEVAEENHLSPHWLNDGVKGWLSRSEELIAENMPQFSHLRVFRPSTRYLLAMKCLAARSTGFDTQGDLADVRFLCAELGLTLPESVFQVVEEFYPVQLIQPKTRFLIEELLDGTAPS